MNYPKNPLKVWLPVAYLPAVEYFAYLANADEAIIELNETYPRQSWRNRCSILTANGALDLIIPVKKPDGNHSKTGNVLISDHENWQKKHWRSIMSAYNKAPYFFYYRDILLPFYEGRQPVKLWEFNQNLMQVLMDELSINTRTSHSESYKHRSDDALDLREVLTPKTHRRPVQTQIEWPVYQQVFSDRHGFNANLSIVDLLFNLGPDARDYLENLRKQNMLQQIASKKPTD